MLKHVCHPKFSPLPWEASPLFSKSPAQTAFPTSHFPDSGWIKLPGSICVKEKILLQVFFNIATNTKVFHPACPISPYPFLLGHQLPVWPYMGHTVPGTSAPPPEEGPANSSWVYCLLLCNSYLSRHEFGWTVIYPGATKQPLWWGNRSASGMTSPRGTGDRASPSSAPASPCSTPAFWKAKGLKIHFGGTQPRYPTSWFWFWISAGLRREADIGTDVPRDIYSLTKIY